MEQASSLTKVLQSHKVKVGMTVFVISLLLAVAVTIANKTAIEEEIYQRADELLEQSGYRRVIVEMDGRDVHLSGDVSSRDTEKQVIRRIRGLAGVGELSSSLRITPLRLPHLRISGMKDGRLIIQGELPSRPQLNQFIDGFKQWLTHDEIVNRVTIDPEVTQPSWGDALQEVIMKSDVLEGIVMEIGAGSLQLGGLIETEDQYHELIRHLTPVLQKNRLILINKMGFKE